MAVGTEAAALIVFAIVEVRSGVIVRAKKMPSGQQRASIGVAEAQLMTAHLPSLN